MFRTPTTRSTIFYSQFSHFHAPVHIDEQIIYSGEKYCVYVTFRNKNRCFFYQFRCPIYMSNKKYKIMNHTLNTPKLHYILANYFTNYRNMNISCYTRHIRILAIWVSGVNFQTELFTSLCAFSYLQLTELLPRTSEYSNCPQPDAGIDD